jgi:hypothetical protein
MSIQNAPIDEERAKIKAQKELAHEIGNLPYLGDMEHEDNEYVFPLHVRLPRVIFDESRQTPQDVKFLSSKRVGEIRVNAESGEVNRTRIHDIKSNIRQQKRVVEEAVQKALVRSSARKFSKLPFPELRYTPILDILSQLLIEGLIEEEEIESMSSQYERHYKDYIEILEEAGLVRMNDGQVEADDYLIEIEARDASPPEKLNAAIAHFFEEGTNDIDTIRQILGPYLTLAGFYYMQVLESGEMPRVTEDEFREQLDKTYTGSDRELKKFKLAHYLIQLEDVGLLESDDEDGPRTWEGEKDVWDDILREQDLLEPASEIIA